MTKSCSQQPTTQPTRAQVQRSIEQWAEEFGSSATHALTLTFDGGQIDRLTRHSASIHGANDPRMVAWYSASMRRFRQLLDKRLHGNKSARYGNQLLLVPVLEGLRDGQNPHYHCLLGVTPDRIAAVEAAVRECWAKVDFAGRHNTIDRIYDQGFHRYATKHANSLDHINVDWGNVVKPAWSRATAE